MLTDVDIQYLVGLFCRLTNPENVDVTLGDRVYNEASNSKRDVDVTITYKDETGKPCSVSGIEVKDHSKPLDVIHVEQLCAKLKTHPTISYSQIVSASGYTKGAREAARFYGVDLLRLEKWDMEKYGFEHVHYHEKLTFTEVLFSWAGTPHVTFNPENILSQLQQDILIGSSKVFDQRGELIEGILTLSDLATRMRRNALDTAKSTQAFNSIPRDTEQDVIIDVTISDSPRVQCGEEMIELNMARIEGKIKREEFSSIPEYKILVFDSTDELMVGTAISELKSGTLIGLTISSHNRNISAAIIPITDRLKKKIFMKEL